MKWNKKFWRVNYKLAKKKYGIHLQYFSLFLGFVIAYGAISTGISKYKRYKQGQMVSTFTLWQNSQRESLFRAPAGKRKTKRTCSYNYVDLNQIKNEVKTLEAKYQTGSVIEGQFYGMDLSILPSIGSQLLADFKNLIGDRNKNLNFSRCKNVPCVFNQIYDDDSQMSGYFVYFWYLKTGSMISLSNYIPNQKSITSGVYNKKKYNYTDYLFSKDELQKFYFLAKSLPEKLKFIPILKSIHKIPGNSNIENEKPSICSQALPNGQILLNRNCLSQKSNYFNINVAKEIAKYADRHEGVKQKLSSLSSSKEFIQFGKWVKESYFNPHLHKFEYKWQTNIPNEEMVDFESKRSPSEFLATLVAHYRYNPIEFKKKTPLVIQDWISKEIFNGTTYDPYGLYMQYIQQALDSWARQEVGLWKDCLDTHLKKKNIDELQKEVAKNLEHPLYACVDKKIPAFARFTKKHIQLKNYEGCEFFNAPEMVEVENRFNNNIHKYLLEKILQRKIEIQKHGFEVLTGQEIKDKFISTVDPKSQYIQCFAHSSPKKCYDTKMKNKLADIISEHSNLSNYYKDIINDDILGIFPYEFIKRKSNEAAKLFLAPYSARLHQAANKLWNSCKQGGMDHDEHLQIPMKFSGGRYFVNPKLINCINDKVEEELFALAGLKAFQNHNGEREEFSLNKKEQDFALSFLEGKLLQTLNNLLDDEYLAEQLRFDQHFKKAKLAAFQTFSEDEDLTVNIFSHQQVENLCMKKVESYYPENYFYHSKPAMDKIYGRFICSRFVSQPDINKILNEQIRLQWQRNKELAADLLRENYQEEIDECYSKFPVERRDRNKTYRGYCFNDAFMDAINTTIQDWQGHENYKYYTNREKEIRDYLEQSFRNKFISKAQRNESLTETRTPATK